MRQSGVVDDTRGLGPHDHVCWGFTDAASFRAQATNFLAEGLALGQQATYVGPAAEEVADGLRAIADPDLPAGAVHGQAGLPDDVFEPATQVAAYAQAAQDALAAGFSGLRVATDVTPLVDTPDRLDAVARYEYLVDQYMADRPFAAMCGFNEPVLGPDAVAQVACMHPTATPGATQFRLHASSERECRAALGGELDLVTDTLFPLALDRAELWPNEDGDLVLDAAELRFIDHGGMSRLVGLAQRLSCTVVLRTEQAIPGRVVELLDGDGVRVERRT